MQEFGKTHRELTQVFNEGRRGRQPILVSAMNLNYTLVLMKLYSTDTPAELELVRQEALAAGADAAVVTNHYAKGGAGAIDLANAAIAACEGESNFKFLYELDKSIEEKIEVISKEIYGADGIQLSEHAQKQVDTYTKQGYGGLPSKWIRQSLFIDNN